MDLGRHHILVVDDSADTADSMAELLSIWGYDAHACYCGATALESALVRCPRVVLLDVAMPRMDGFRFVELFRELPFCDAVPIIAVSGYGGAANYARAREAEVQHYLLKPTDPGRLRDVLARQIVPASDRSRGVRADFGQTHYKKDESSVQRA